MFKVYIRFWQKFRQLVDFTNRTVTKGNAEARFIIANFNMD